MHTLITSEFYGVLYDVFHHTFLIEEYPRAEWARLKNSSSIWKKLLDKQLLDKQLLDKPIRRKVSILFAGAKGSIGHMFFYWLRQEFFPKNPKEKPPRQEYPIERLVLIKVLVYVGVGRKTKKNGLVRDLDFDTINKHDEWTKINTEETLDFLLKKFCVDHGLKPTIVSHMVNRSAKKEDTPIRKGKDDRSKFRIKQQGSPLPTPPPTKSVEMPLPYENFNSFVFGKIEIPSLIIASSYSDPYRQGDIEINHTDELFESKSDYPIELETAFDELLEYTIKTFNITRYNRTAMARIDDLEHEPEDENDRGGKLILHFSNTKYERFLATNHALEAEINPGVTVREKYGSGPYHDFTESVLSNAIGLECIVISDNPNQHPQRQVIIRKRAAKNVNSYRGFYQGSAGGFMSTAHVDKAGKPSPFVTASVETKQEVSGLLTGVEPDDFRMLGLTIQWHLLQPIFFGYFVTQMLAKEILGGPGRDAYEGRTHSIPFTPESVINHIAENDWVPNSALAMIFTLLAEFSAHEVTAVAENLPKSKKAEDFRMT